MTDEKVSQKSLEIISSRNWISDWFRWCPTSFELLKQAESKLFSYFKNPYEVSFVTITTDDGAECSIRSLSTSKYTEGKNTPLVMLHGLGSSIGLWILNIDKLCQDRPIYAPDILGFGLSSRPNFSKVAEIAENQFVESIEEWRKQIGLDQFILLGHSMGGYLAAAYSIKYPGRVKHLILADPWGFPTYEAPPRMVIPVWFKAIDTIMRPFNPLAPLRIAGPWGPQLLARMRPDILIKFEGTVTDLSDVANYIYHCNAQYPSGESAFKAMAAPLGWAKRPMIERISQLRQDIPITFIYGARSWINSSSGLNTRTIRKSSFVDVKIIQKAGHHVYADRSEEFNEIVNSVCKKVDMNQVLSCLSEEKLSTRTINVPTENVINTL